MIYSVKRAAYQPALPTYLTSQLLPLSALHPPNNVISFGEEREPIIQHTLLFLPKIIIVRPAILGLERRLRQGPRGVFTRKN